MLIAISGSQGSGKSTVLNGLKDMSYNVIERKTSRSILSEWEVTLDEVNNNHDLTIKFQNEITKRKWEDEITAIASPEFWFTERTHMDLFTYALSVLGRDNNYNDWLNRYYDTCVAHTKAYHAIYFLPNTCFDVESDGVRGENKHYSQMVNTMLLQYLQQSHSKKLIVVNECNVSERISTITKFKIK